MTYLPYFVPRFLTTLVRLEVVVITTLVYALGVVYYPVCHSVLLMTMMM